MKIKEMEFSVSSKSRNEILDITDKVQQAIEESEIKNGDVIVYCPHTTAGITINENADRSVLHDITLTLNELIPEGRNGYRHMEGNSDSHCKSSIIGASEQLLIKEGMLRLGTWQGVFFCEFDGPRNRKVFVQIKGE
jgi:secondary thiamine-phosphate synthase enzyme